MRADDSFLLSVEAADYLGVDNSVLGARRQLGKGPPFIMLEDSEAAYPLEGLNGWAESWATDFEFRNKGGESNIPITLPSSSNILEFAIDFKNTAEVALSRSLPIVSKLLPVGNMCEDLLWAPNPTRSDTKPDSLMVDLTAGWWTDDEVDDRGDDLISLVAYLRGTSRLDGALWLQGYLQMGGSL